MGRTLMALVLLAAVTQAQVGVLPISQSQPVAMDPTVFAQPVVEVFPRYTALRRGTEEKVLLAASLNSTARSWTAIYWAACDLSRRCSHRRRAADGRSVTETTMRAVEVVMLQPGREML